MRLHIDFDEYKRLGEPEKAEKSEIWQTAIGLQAVDGLIPSEYLVETARQNIEGKITIYKVQERLNDYYKVKPAASADDRTEEADKVSARIVEILSEKTFSFSPAEYITIHKRLFTGIYKFAGKIRDYNISKAEWVLDGETVYYASADSIRATLNYDFEQEKSFVYRGLSKEQIVEHITKFVSGLWQIHPFGEGNTRTTAVFVIKYLRTLGFSITNDLFYDHSRYFRNALVRANYNDYNKVPANVSVKAEDVPVNVPVKRKATILKMLLVNPNLTAEELAAIFSVTDKTIKRDFAALKNDGKIKRVGSDKTGHWEVIQ